MSAPKPRDPRELGVTPEGVGKQVEAILNEPADTLADEVAQLSAAHDVLHAALHED